ncbi:short-chain dehydrogenase [Phlebopus sp. FC_14]|nr:short-chain dehydrogenase [Phlebopus sp. FC_14]
MGKASFRNFLREQWTQIPVPSADVSNKSVVVVGSTVGLGFEAAVHLAKLKPKTLLLTSRDDEKCKRTKDEVEQRSTFTGIESWPLELGSFDSVRKFADRVDAEGISVNAFIANAGISTFKYGQTQDGWESTLQVNYLSTTLLSILMLPHLIKAATAEDASRLVIVSSEAHFFVTKLEGADKWPSILGKLSDEAYCTSSIMRTRYDVSKMLEIMFVRELASRLPDTTPVAVSAVNPGFCHSRISRTVDEDFLFGLILRVARTFLARTTEVGSRTLVHPAVEPNERSRHGHYLSCCAVTEESDYILSDEGKEVSRRLWAETIEILGQIDPRVNRIVSDYLLGK